MFYYNTLIMTQQMFYCNVLTKIQLKFIIAF
jgi:hypothetical protein